MNRQRIILFREAFGLTLLAGLSFSAALIGTAHPAVAQTELELLKQQLQALSERIEQLEAENAVQTERVAEVEETIETEVVRSGNSLGDFILPGTGTRIQIGGFVKGDFIYDASGDIGADDLFVASSIGVDEGDDRRFTAHARESRLSVRTTTPSSFGPIKTLFEGDFFGFGPVGTEVLTNSFSFRIRHLYGEVGPIGGGQFWTNFMPIETFARTVDFQGTAGASFIRQAQLRFTQPVGDNLVLRASLENSEFSGRIDADGDPTTTDLLPFGDTAPGPLGGLEASLDVAPDVTLTALYTGDFGLVRGAVVGRRFGGQDGGDGAFGYGLNAAARLNLWGGATGLASLTWGDGVGRYIIDGVGLDGVIDADGDVDTIQSLGFSAQLQQKVTDDLTLAVAYGRFDVFDTFLPDDIDTLQTLHASAFFTPFDRVTFGGEVIFGMRENADGADDTALRLQTSVQVNF
ncbi:MAG: DcaP family trimeric outer membrane transporter [Pseudomonadota bacterium]